MGTITWKKTTFTDIEAAWDNSKLWEEKPTPIVSKNLKGGTAYLRQYKTPDGLSYAQRFDLLTNLPIGVVFEGEVKVDKPQERIRRKGRTTKKPDRVWAAPQPPLEQFLPGPERKVSKWKYEQVRWSMAEWKAFYEEKFKMNCEIYQVMLIRYPCDNREFEYYETPEGHIVSRTLYNPIEEA